MKGLLLKDFYMIRSGLFTLLAMIIFIGAGMSIVISAEALIIISGIMVSMQTMSMIAMDKSSKWDMFGATLPVSKSSVFSSRYLMNLLLAIAGTVFGAIVVIAVSLCTHSLDLRSILSYALLSLMMSLLPSAINIPLNIVFDASKHVVGMVLSYTFVILILASTLVVAAGFVQIQDYFLLITAVLAGISVLIYTGSWLVAPKLLSHRDL